MTEVTPATEKTTSHPRPAVGAGAGTRGDEELGDGVSSGGA